MARIWKLTLLQYSCQLSSYGNENLGRRISGSGIRKDLKRKKIRMKYYFYMGSQFEKILYHFFTNGWILNFKIKLINIKTYTDRQRASNSRFLVMLARR